MAFTKEQLNRIYEKTNGKCHICRKKLAHGNYGVAGTRGAWEVEHSKPRSNGGTDHGNNLFAACISCNRSKSNGSTKAAREKHGYKCAPFSETQKVRNSIANAGIFGIVGLIFTPPHLRIAVTIAAVVLSGSIGYNEEPE